MKSHEWTQLERLCRKALDALDEAGVDPNHPIVEAIKTTGAYATAVPIHERQLRNREGR